MRAPSGICPSHTWASFAPKLQRLVVENTIERIRRLGKVQAVAACGHSGLIIGAIVTHSLGLPLIAVRKKGEDPQAGMSGNEINFVTHQPIHRWVIVDDVVCSGQTLWHIVHQIAKYADNLQVPGLLPAAVLLTHSTQHEDAERYLQAYSTGFNYCIGRHATSDEHPRVTAVRKLAERQPIPFIRMGYSAESGLTVATKE